MNSARRIPQKQVGHFQTITSSPDVKYNHNMAQIEVATAGINTRKLSCPCLTDEKFKLDKKEKIPHKQTNLK